MDTTKLSQGALIAAGAGALLLVSTFMPWVGADGIDSENVWKIPIAPFDLFLIIVALVAVVPAVMAMTGGVGTLPFGLSPGGTNALLGGMAAFLILVLWFNGIPDGASAKIGLFLGLIAAGGIAYGGFTESQDEVVASNRDAHGDRLT